MTIQFDDLQVCCLSPLSYMNYMIRVLHTCGGHTAPHAGESGVSVTILFFFGAKLYLFSLNFNLIIFNIFIFLKLCILISLSIFITNLFTRSETFSIFGQK